jgi:GrpB-like predicted nucleotidyltransferase (UPF0157 family)
MTAGARTLRLEPQDASWPARFAIAASALRHALGADALAIEHVGSTAVPGLAGKPVLDVAIAVADTRSAARSVAPLRALGYRYRGHNGDDVRRHYFVRELRGVRTEQLHLYILPATGWDESLRFRDALRADPALAAAYAAEKYRVADAVGWDKAAYAVAKGGFVERVLAGEFT